MFLICQFGHFEASQIGDSAKSLELVAAALLVFQNSDLGCFGSRSAPEKSSCDSGVITPSEGGSLTSPDHSENGPKLVASSYDQLVNPSDQAVSNPVPMKASTVSPEVQEDRF